MFSGCYCWLWIIYQLLFPITRKHISECLCFNGTHQCVSQSCMTAVSLDGDGCGCALLARCYGCRALSWRKLEAVGMWTRTGIPRHSPCFQMVRAGKASRGTPAGVFGNRCCCCCTSDPGENERETSTPLDTQGDPMAKGQMWRPADRDPVGHRRLQWLSYANIQPLCPSPTAAQPPCLAPSGGTALCLVWVQYPSPSGALTLWVTLSPWLSSAPPPCAEALPLCPSGSCHLCPAWGCDSLLAW